MSGLLRSFDELRRRASAAPQVDQNPRDHAPSVTASGQNGVVSRAGDQLGSGAMWAKTWSGSVHEAQQLVHGQRQLSRMPFSGSAIYIGSTALGTTQISWSLRMLRPRTAVTACCRGRIESSRAISRRGSTSTSPISAVADFWCSIRTGRYTGSANIRISIHTASCAAAVRVDTERSTAAGRHTEALRNVRISLCRGTSLTKVLELATTRTDVAFCRLPPRDMVHVHDRHDHVREVPILIRQ